MTRQMRGTKIPVRSEIEAKVIDGWLASVLQESTARTYEYVINDWITWCRNRGVDPLNPLRFDVDTWRQHLARRYEAVTVKKKLSALSSLLKYGIAEHDEFVSDNPVKRVTLPKVSNVSNREALDRDEALRALEVASRNGPRDAAVTHLLFWSGIRVAELRSARAGGFTTHNSERYLSVLRKGGKRQPVLIPEPAIGAVTAYLDGRTDGPLILGARGTAISRYEVANIVARACAGVTSKCITPHSLRHTFATLSLDAGADPLAVQEAMGHTSFATTQRYNHSATRVGRAPGNVLTQLLREGATP